MVRTTYLVMALMIIASPAAVAEPPDAGVGVALSGIVLVAGTFALLGGIAAGAPTLVLIGSIVDIIGGFGLIASAMATTNE